MKGMRLVLSAAVAAWFALGFAPDARALTISPSEPVLMIDGTGDANATVTVGVTDTSSGFDFGYYDGSFNLILADASSFATTVFAGGDVVDFAIMDTTTSAIFKLSDGTATMDFSGLVDASFSQNPVVPYDYYQNLTITWTVGNNDLVFNLNDPNDGFSPASGPPNMPEPGAALVFGLGFAIFAHRIRRAHRSH